MYSESVMKPIRLVRRDILRVIQTYINKETNFQMFNQHMLGTL
jgi:septum formation topological specificity factor MinE